MKSSENVINNVISNISPANISPAATNVDACYRYSKPVARTRKRRQSCDIPTEEVLSIKIRKMNSSTPVNQGTIRAVDNDPELESPILAIAPGGEVNIQMGMVDGSILNESTDGGSYQDRNEGGNVTRSKTNLSNDLQATRIGSTLNNDNSSREYAAGVDSLQIAAIGNGILDETGAHIKDCVENVGNLIGHNESSATGQLDGVDINTWNSASTFSNRDPSNDYILECETTDNLGDKEEKDGCENMEEGVVEKVCPIDHIVWGGDNKISPRDGGERVKSEKDPFTTPKRKLSPNELTPLGRAFKLTTDMEASPQLRSQLVLHQPAKIPTLRDGAPDLICGIGRLQLKVAPTTEEKLEATGPALGSATTTVVPQRQNIAQRLIREANRQRATSVGERGGRRTIRRRNWGPRSHSLEGQQRIDIMFSPSNTRSARDEDNSNGNTEKSSS